MTCDFHRMKLVLVSFLDGRAPRLRETVDEDDMATMVEDDGDGGEGKTRKEAAG